MIAPSVLIYAGPANARHRAAPRGQAAVRDVVWGCLTDLTMGLIDAGCFVDVWESDRWRLEAELASTRVDLILDLSQDLRLPPAPARRDGRRVNASRVQYGPLASQRLAAELTDALADWGHCCVHGHLAHPPARRGELVRPSDPAFPVHALAVEPFDMAGPHVPDYLQHLGLLGRTLATAVAGHFTADARAG